MPGFETEILGQKISVEYETDSNARMQTTTSGTPRIDVRVLRVDGIDPKGLNRTVRSKVQTAIRRDMGFGGQLIASWETDIKRSRIRSHQIVDEDGDTETTVKEIRALFGTQPIQSTE